ncbi:hypothetical protein T02_8881 [Trichinella nativa]|uniref:Uncharacterized protein n=1 Tax=Trichinella nativa TaxID=6335 RepID=A0A0V1KM21_9BILA|nr:hypothetical protein T02_8881 [Trichinella nativa]
MTYRPLNRTCLGTSAHSEELWSYTLAFRPRRDGYRTSGHDIAIADLVGTSRNPVMDQSVGRWGSLLGILTGRGESCVDRYLNCGLVHCWHILCLELFGDSCAEWMVSRSILELPLLLWEIQSTAHENQNTVSF